VTVRRPSGRAAQSAVVWYMQVAITGILRSAGLRACDADDAATSTLVKVEFP